MINPHLHEVSLGALRANPDQPRAVFNEAGLDSLADSIRQHGLLQPIVIKRDPDMKKRYIIVAGERRARAFELLGRSTIPAILTIGKADELALIENVQRQDLNAIEEANALKSLRERHGYTHEELSRIVGKARSTITNLLRLAELPPHIQRESSTSNAASKSLLIEISKERGPEKQRQLWEAAKAGKGTVREARARKRGRHPNTAPAAQPSPLPPPHELLAQGSAFVDRLERHVSTDTSLDDDLYEVLLELYRRFLDLIELEARKRGVTPR